MASFCPFVLCSLNRIKPNNPLFFADKPTGTIPVFSFLGGFMNITEKIVAGTAKILSFDYSKSDPSKEDSNMSLSFYVEGLLENVGSKKKPIIAPTEISKRSVMDTFGSMADFLDDEESLKTHEGRLKLISSYPAERMHKKIVGSYDSKAKEYRNGLLGGGILSIVSSTLAEVNEIQDRENYVPDPAEINLAFATLLTGMSQKIEEYSKAESQADPTLDVKRRFLKTGQYKFISVAENPADLVKSQIELEIANLQALILKADEVSKEDYLAFLEEKNSANGQDEDGYVKARGSKKEETKK